MHTTAGVKCFQELLIILNVYISMYDLLDMKMKLFIICISTNVIINV